MRSSGQRSGEVSRFLTRLAGPTDVEDLTQETFIRALRSVHRFAARSRGRTWLLSIAHWVAVDHVRSGARDSTEPPGYAADGEIVYRRKADRLQDARELHQQRPRRVRQRQVSHAFDNLFHGCVSVIWPRCDGADSSDRRNAATSMVRDPSSVSE
jgi:DNA-directed RNA polymerase specialized sigma24 family protein